jgi:predicted transcriptional regulator
MALTNDVLKDFFNLSKEQKPFIKIPVSNKNSNLTDFDSSISKKQYKNYRVFDDPLELGQTKDKTKTNLGQRWDKLRTKVGQKNKTQDKHGTKLKTELKTDLGQSWDKVGTKVNFSSLVGLQRNIIIFLYEICKAFRDKITSPLSIEYIASSCKTTKSSAQKTIQRLEKKRLLKRAEFKNGRSGWTKYELPEFIYQEVLHAETQDKPKTNLGQRWDKGGTELRTELRTSLSSSNSNNIYKETTTGNTPGTTELQLLPEWQNLDLEPLSKIGFTTTHLSQIAEQNKLQPQAVQDSIYAFAFDLQKNNKAKNIKGDPINFFMGILRNGRIYTFPSNYESPQDKAMRLYAEQRRAIEQKKKLLEKESLDLAFTEWFGQLTNAQKMAFLPENIQNTKIAFGKNKIIENEARSHFELDIWPDKKQEIIKSTENLEQDLQNQIPTNRTGGVQCRK